MRPRLVLATVVTGSFAALPLAASFHPNMDRGFDPEGAFQVGQVDSVSLFNGSLSLVIPIGQRYPVNGGFSYGLTLTYNSNVWEFQNVVEGGQTYTEALPSPFSNAGLGWMLSLGELLAPNDSPKNQTGRWMYVGPDGGSHLFYDELHIGDSDGSANTLYSRDGSYLRLVEVPGQNFTTWKRIEIPDGTLHTFHKVSGTWRVETIQDRSGNSLSISYAVANEWQLTDSHGRLTRVVFEPAANLPDRVKKVVVPIFGGGIGGGAAEVLFAYRNETRVRSCKDTYPGNDPDTMTLSLLTSVTLPDGSYWEMKADDGTGAYGRGCSPADVSGTIERLRLPTGGRLEWTYQSYHYPEGPTSWLNTTTGVLERQLVRKDGTVEAAWTYANKRWRPSPEEPHDEVHTYLTAPDGVCTKHYFTAPPRLDTGTWKGWEYGLPFSWREDDGQGRYISTELWDASVVDGAGDRVCSGTKVVSTFLAFAHDKLPSPTGESAKPDWYNTNRRLAAQSSRYDTDGGRYTSVVQSDFDGLGHYRRAVTSGTLQANDYPWSDVTAVIHFNRSTGTYEIDPATNQPTLAHTYKTLPVSEEWILGIFDYQQATDLGVTQGETLTRADVSFNRTTGFLDCVRRLKTGESRGANDVVTLYTPDANGNVLRQRVFGGDTNPIPVTATCDVGGAFAFRVDHTYQYGARKTSQVWKLPGPAAFPYLSFDADIDPYTGLVKRTRDPQLRTVDYTYDALGRPTEAVPIEVARVVYTYAKATPTSRPKVTVQAKSNGGATVLTQSEVEFDDFGRVSLRRQRLPGNVWSEQQTLYDGAGRVASVSVPGDLAKKTEYLDRDPLGRPRTIRPPDGSTHDVLLSYFGARRVDTQVKVATSVDSESYATRREFYDNAGRFRKVMEASGAGGAEVKTEYRYDAGGRLSFISQDHGGSPNQQRLFTYDNRGFLLQERHPEKGDGDDQAGNWVYYTNYDAAGRVGQLVDGPNALSFTYDSMGRVVQIRNATLNRPVKDFLYDADPATYGRLAQALRHNYDPATGADSSVGETYTYAGLGGAVSARETSFDAWGYRFVQGFTWDELGELTALAYPTCTEGSCASLPAGVGTVTSTYSDGRLAQVQGWTGPLSYHRNGLLAALPHANGTTDSQTLEAGSLPRPAQLTSTNGQPTPLWDSGLFAYDGAGNIKAMGANSFLYDAVGRLVRASVAGYTQTYSYDPFGNQLERTTTPPGGSPTTVTFGTYSNRNRLSVASYDTAGALTAWGGNSYTYDEVSHLSKLVTADGSWSYLYTVDDERAGAIQVSGATTTSSFFIRDLGGQLLSHFTRIGSDLPASWTRTRDYLRAGGRLLASRGTEGDHHYHPDHLGTPRVITDTAGAVVARHDYLPYGEEITDPAQNGLPLKFTGHERDQHATGFLDDLDYMHARYYNVHLSRFLSPDSVRGAPSVPQTLNRYQYVRASPLNYSDPTGRHAVQCMWLDPVTNDLIDAFCDEISVTGGGFGLGPGDDWSCQITGLCDPGPGGGGGEGGGGGGGGDTPPPTPVPEPTPDPDPDPDPEPEPGPEGDGGSDCVSTYTGPSLRAAPVLLRGTGDYSAFSLSVGPATGGVMEDRNGQLYIGIGWSSPLSGGIAFVIGSVRNGGSGSLRSQLAGPSRNVALILGSGIGRTRGGWPWQIGGPTFSEAGFGVDIGYSAVYWIPVGGSPQADCDDE